MLDDPACDLPALIIAEGHDLMAQIAEKTERIDTKTKELKALASETDTARRLQTMPGVGPLTALAVEAFAPNIAQFKYGWGSCHTSIPLEAKSVSAAYPKRGRATSGGS